MIAEHNAAEDSAALSRAWRAFQSSSGVRIAPPRTEAESSALVALMNDLLDLRTEFGFQSVVSEVLNAKRKITAVQAKMLGSRFAVSPALIPIRSPLA